MTQPFDAAGAKARCRKFRKRILDISQTVSALHIAPSFSCLELVDATYFGLMKRTGNRDIDDTFILSKGHGSLAQYVVLEELGILSKDQMNNHCKPGWPLCTHPDYGTPGIEASTGSLGHGLPLAVGMAYADKCNGIDRDIYLVMSDGELMEGSVWEALMTAPSLGVNRIIAIIDLNDFQSLGQTSKILPNFYPIVDKIKAFGWEAVEVDGHDGEAVCRAVKAWNRNKPLVVLGKTTKGKGVSYMENVPIWHYRSPNAEEYKIGIQQIEGCVT